MIMAQIEPKHERNAITRGAVVDKGRSCMVDMQPRALKSGCRFSPIKLPAHESACCCDPDRVLAIRHLRGELRAMEPGCIRQRMRQVVVWPAATANTSVDSSFVKMAANLLPVAIFCAPVRVAMSMTRSGCAPATSPGKRGGSAVACATPSERTAALRVRVDLTGAARKEGQHAVVAEGRRADGVLGEAEHTTQGRAARADCDRRLKAPISPAAPPMSAFMPHIPSRASMRGHQCRTQSLPHEAHRLLRRADRHVREDAQGRWPGGSLAHAAAGRACAAPASITSTATSRPLARRRAAAACASSTNAVVVSCSGGVSTRRAASLLRSLRARPVDAPWTVRYDGGTRHEADAHAPTRFSDWRTLFIE